MNVYLEMVVFYFFGSLFPFFGSLFPFFGKNLNVLNKVEFFGQYFQSL
jgi:hypothetical protein